MAKQRIQNLEQNLTDHPLALYPHLEKSVPIEVYATLIIAQATALANSQMFDEVVELLDPDMKPTGSELEVNQI